MFDRGIGCEKKSDSIVSVGLDLVGYSRGLVDKSATYTWGQYVYTRCGKLRTSIPKAVYDGL